MVDLNSNQLKNCLMGLISLLFDKCSMLLHIQSHLNHTSYRNYHFNEFVANALCDNIGSKKKPLTSANENVF